MTCFLLSLSLSIESIVRSLFSFFFLSSLLHIANVMYSRFPFCLLQYVEFRMLMKTKMMIIMVQNKILGRKKKGHKRQDRNENLHYNIISCFFSSFIISLNNQLWELDIQNNQIVKEQPLIAWRFIRMRSCKSPICSFLSSS